MRTPKAGSKKTWSHAMDNFKSVSKREKKKLTPEERKKLRQKRKHSRHQSTKSTQDGGDGDGKRGEKRSSVRNPMSGLGSSNKRLLPSNGSSDESGVAAAAGGGSSKSIKMIQPETSTE